MDKKQKKPKTSVTVYGMSLHFGVCTGPVEYMWQILVEEKPAWPNALLSTTMIRDASTWEMTLPNLFGGLGKEGGLEGNITWLPGESDQVMPEVLAAKFGRTSATMPAYRGIASIFFWGEGRKITDFGGHVTGFYWRANSPYLPGVWVGVGRASIGLAALYARIFWTTATGTQPGIDFGTLGTGNRPYRWDTNGNWCVHDEHTADVYTLPGGELRTISTDDNQTVSAGRCHITDDGELVRLICDSSAGGPQYFYFYDLSDADLAVTQTIYVNTNTEPGDHNNVGFVMDDVIAADGTRYALAWIFHINATANYTATLILLSKTLGSAWGIEWQEIVFPTASELYYVLSMGREYAYTTGDDGFLLIHWNGTFSATVMTPPGLAGREIRIAHYFEDTDEVVVICTNGDILVYDPALTTLKRQRTGNSAGLGQPGGPLWKRMDLGFGFIALPEIDTITSRTEYIRVFNVRDLSLTKTITIDDTPFVNQEVVYDYCGINKTFSGTFMMRHQYGGIGDQPSSFWFFEPFGKFDSNPAHIIYECLTNTAWGMGAPSNAIDVAAFEAAAAVLYGEAFGLSMIWTRSGAIEDFITEVLDHIEATLFVNPRNGLLTLKLIRNDYSVPSLPVFTPDNSIVTNFSRKLWGETINEIVVTWTNPDNEEEETVVAQDLANIEAQGGVISDSRNYYGVRNASLATRLAHRDLRSASTPLAKCDIEINRKAWDLLPGDCCVLDSPEDGIEQIVMRVGPVDYGKPGDSAVRVSLLEDIFSLALADYTEPPESLWVDSSETPSPIDYSQIITLPYYAVVNLIAAAVLADVDYPEVFAGVLAAENGHDTDTFQLYGQTTNAAGVTSYGNFGTKRIASRATLTAALSIEVETVILAFPDRTQGNGPVVGGLMILQGVNETISEICLVSGFGAGGYTFRRGVLDTVPRAWPAGTPVWFVDETMDFIDDVDIRAVGETVNYKILPSTSRGTLAQASAPVISKVMTERPHLPLRPADVTINGDDGFAGIIDCNGVDPIPVTWARRNRETETALIKAWDDGDVTPEAGQTTTVTLTDMAGAVLHTYSGIAGTSQDVDAVDFASASEGYIIVSSERDGLESLQSWRVHVLINFVAFTFEDDGAFSFEDGEIKGFED